MGWGRRIFWDLCDESWDLPGCFADRGFEKIEVGSIDINRKGIFFTEFVTMHANQLTFLQPGNLPKYTHPLLLRLFKNTPYQQFINAYPNNVNQLREVYEKEKQTFNHVGYLISSIGVLFNSNCIGQKHGTSHPSYGARPAMGTQETHFNLCYSSSLWYRPSD